MTLKFTLFSQEVEDFVLEIKIDADATFMDLHKLILEACKYTEDRNHCFMICDEDWRVENRILLHEPAHMGSDEDLYLMENTPLSDFLEDEGQRMAYVFDADGKRVFLMELTENIFGHPQAKPVISRRHGQAPSQFEEEETPVKPAETSATEIMEEFYGDDGYEEGEIDMEGFEIEDQ